MIKNLLIIIALLGMAAMMWVLAVGFRPPQTLNALSAEYVTGSARDLNMPNTVTSVVVTYRGLDTLGEVTVLFLATAGVGFFLRRKRHTGKVKTGEHSEQTTESRRQGSEILQTGSGLLIPLILMFGVYIFVHGHLTPGGGFQGGVVIASGFLLLLLADNKFKFSHPVIDWLESLSGMSYVMMGLIGLLMLGADHFLDPRWLEAGRWGKLFSAGAVPIIYSLIGLKVGAEMSGLLDSMQTDGEAE